MPRPLDDDKRRAITDAIRAGSGTRSAGSIAKEFGVGRTTVLRIAEQAGLGHDAWDRTKTKKATEAHQVDLSARLINQASRNAGVAEQILESFESMALDDWIRVSAHSRGIVLGILQDKAVALMPPDDDGREDRKSALADLFELMRASAGP